MLYLKRYCTVKKSWATPHLFSFARKNILPLQREEPVLCVSVSSLMSRVFRISFLKFYVTVDANKSSSSFSFGENLVKVAPNANKLLKTSHYPHFILMDFLIIFQQYTRLLAVYLGSLLKMKSLPIRHSSEGGSKSENTFLCSKFTKLTQIFNPVPVYFLTTTLPLRQFLMIR